MATAQEILDLARVPLVDAAGIRYNDTDGLRYLNFALKALRRQRADLFLGKLKGNFTDLLGTDPVPTPENTHQALADYVTARFETHDDEQAMNARAKDFFSMAAGGL